MLSLRNFRIPRPATVGVAMAIGLLSMPVLAGPASANTSPNNAVMGGFEVDGNLYPGFDNSVINGSYAAGANTDWSAVGAPVAQDPIGTADTTVFSTGSKDDTPSGWQLNGSAGASSKGDIGNVYYHGTVQKVGGVNHLFAFFGFERASNNGTVQYIAELNAKPNKINAYGVSVPDRAVGDIELLITQQGNSPLVLQETANQWNGTGWVPLTPQPWLVGYGNDTNIPSLVGKWSGVNDPIAIAGGPSGYLVPQYQFAEVGVDLTGLLGLSNSCDTNYKGFSELNVRSQTSTNGNPELKDYVNPIGINIPPNCSQITIKKVTDPSSDTTTVFPFTTNLTGTLDSSSNVAAGTTPTSFSLKNGGAMVDKTVVPNQAYNISEGTLPAHWAFESVVCKDDTSGATISVTPGTNGAISVTPGTYQAITCTYTNQFQLIAADPIGVAITATPAYTKTFKWDIAKSVDKTKFTAPAGNTVTANYDVTVTHDSGTGSAWTVTGNVTLTNPNAFAVNSITASIPSSFLGGSCTLTGGAAHTIAANTSENLPYTCTYSSAPSPSSGTLTATASWPSPQFPYKWATTSGSASASVDFGATTPTIVDGTVTVTDTLGGSLGTVAYTDPSPTHFTYPVTFTAPSGTCATHDNTATFTTNTSHTTGSASKSVQVCGGVDLTVTKTVTPSYTRTYTWGITKVNTDAGHQLFGPAGSTQTAHYTVSVTHDNGTDSGWALTGTISVTNPNDWESITADITDTFPGSCVVTGGTSVTIAPGATVTLNYNCGFAQTPTTPTVNTATATWDATAASTADGSATGTAAFVLGPPTTLVDDSVTVTDTLGGVLGTVSASDPSPTTFSYTAPFTVPSGTCQTFPNTATFTTDTTSTTGSASADVQVCGALPVTVAKTATTAFTRTYHWGIDKAVDHSLFHAPAGATVTANYTVSVTHDAGTDSAWVVRGTITVTNPNDWEPITVDLSDAIDNGGNCAVSNGSGVSIPAGGSVTRPYLCSYTSAPTALSGTNTATATWSASLAHTTASSATGTAAYAFGAPTTIVDGSATITDTFAGTLGTVSYTDPSPKTFTYSRDIVAPNGTCSNTPNTATVTASDSHATHDASANVEVCGGVDLTVSKTATPSFTRTYTWGISKDVDQTHFDAASGSSVTAHYTVSVTHDNGTDSGWALTGTITVTNPNDWEAITADVTDNFPGTCTVVGGSQVTIPAGGSVTLNYSCGFLLSPSTPMINTATATWDATAAATPDGSATGSSPFNLTGGPTTIVDGSVNVTDTLGGTLGTVSYTDPSPTSFTYPVTFTAPSGTCETHPNTATFVTSNTGTTGSASQTVTVCGGVDLQVSKTATTAFTRTYQWTIAKNVDNSAFVLDAFGQATANYTVSVTHDNGTDSGWTVSGNITVTNPNDWEAITADVADTIDNGGTCTVTGGTGVSIPAGGSVTLPYTCTYASAPSASSGTNTATATWDKAAASTPDGSATGTAGYAFGAPTTVVDDSVNVTDTFAGSLGTVSVSDETNPTSFSYSRTFTAGAPGNCTTYPNTAAFVTNTTGATGSASASVSVCAPVVVKHVTKITDKNGTVQGSVSDPVNGPWLDGSNVFAGDVVQYSILVTNPGAVDATTTLTENVPANTTYAGGDNVTWNGCTVGSTAGPCTSTVTVPAGTTQAYTFTVTVDASLAADVNLITNTVLSPDCASQAVQPDLKSAAVADACTVTTPRVPSSVTVLKQDLITTTPLAGATFQLRLGTQLSGNTVVDPGTAVGSPCTTDSTGTCTISNLEPGTYYWQETAAPAGYVLPTGAGAFTVAAEQPTRANAGTTLTVTTVDDITIPVTGCEANPAACVLKVKKVDSVTGAALSGAQFSLYLGSTLVGSCTTGSDGMCQVSFTKTGTYTWVETKAPNGYQLPSNNKVGTVVVNSDFVIDIPVLTVKDVLIPLPHTGLALPVGQMVGWSLASVILGLFLLALARRRRES